MKALSKLLRNKDGSLELFRAVFLITTLLLLVLGSSALWAHLNAPTVVHTFTARITALGQCAQGGRRSTGRCSFQATDADGRQFNFRTRTPRNLGEHLVLEVACAKQEEECHVRLKSS